MKAEVVGERVCQPHAAHGTHQQGVVRISISVAIPTWHKWYLRLPATGPSPRRATTLTRPALPASIQSPPPSGTAHADTVRPSNQGSPWTPPNPSSPRHASHHTQRHAQCWARPSPLTCQRRRRWRSARGQSPWACGRGHRAQGGLYGMREAAACTLQSTYGRQKTNHQPQLPLHCCYHGTQPSPEHAQGGREVTRTSQQPHAPPCAPQPPQRPHTWART